MLIAGEKLERAFEQYDRLKDGGCPKCGFRMFYIEEQLFIAKAFCCEGSDRFVEKMEDIGADYALLCGRAECDWSDMLEIW